jgi:hypothetical protein
MPLHKAESYCLRSKPQVKTHDTCSCQHCTLAVCRVCGQYEGGLTQDCPGVKLSSDVGTLIHSGGLDYTDARGWFVWNADERKTIHHQSRRVRFEPTAENIIRRLAKFKLELLVSNIRLADSTELDALKKDAEYWLNNREGRR